MISTVILLPSTDSRREEVSYKQKYVQEVLVNCLVKLAQEKSVVRWTVRPNMTINYWLGYKESPKTKMMGPDILIL